jgi:hypothetical protein
MNFYECSKKLNELYNKIGSKEYLENETYETIEVELNEAFLNTIKSSINENIYFSASPLDLFIIELEKRMEINKQSEIDFDDIEYIKEVYLFTRKILTAERYWKQDNDYYYLPQLNRKNLILLRSILKKRTDYLEKLLYKKGIEIVVKYPNGDHSIVKRTFKKNIKIMVENDNLQSINPTTKAKQNQNLLFEGKPLNLQERYQIANKVLDIEKKINALNITKDKKNELLSYILDCNIDNAKKLLNGNYDAKPRNLKPYFKDLDLTE